jgi:hypothetical protein
MIGALRLETKNIISNTCKCEADWKKSSASSHSGMPGAHLSHTRTGSRASICRNSRSCSEQSPQHSAPHARQWWRRRKKVNSLSHNTHAVAL